VSSTKPPIPIAKILPKEARDLLITASRIKDDHQRRIALDNAIDNIKFKWPTFFQPPPSIKD
jgi:hypothetical protein